MTVNTRDESATTAATVIHADGVGKSYRMYARPEHRLAQFFFRRRKRPLFKEHWALRDVSFDVVHGETVGIIGRNGSGKSTLLQILCGTLQMSEGRAQTVGRVAALLELGAGFDPAFTGRENVYLVAALHGLSRAQTDARMKAIEAFAEIGEYIDQPVQTYSSGMYVRLAFSIITNVDADILIIDEALAVGDVFFTQKCMRFLDEFRRRGTLLFVSHDAASVVALCDRVVWLDKGVVAQIGPAKQVIEAYTQSAYATLDDRNAPAYSVDEPTTDEVEVGDTVMRVETVDASADPDATAASFDASTTRSFGSRGAEILRASLLRADRTPLSVLFESQTAIIQFTARIHQPLVEPIAGFLVKNRLGQNLFGNNTSSLQVRLPSLERSVDIDVEFEVQVPALAIGEYTIAVAIGEGDHLDPLIHHWIHDAIAFRSDCSGLSGMVDLPVLRAEVISRREKSATADPRQPSAIHE